MYVPPKALMCSRVEVKVKVLQGVKANSYFGSAVFIVHITRVSIFLFSYARYSVVTVVNNCLCSM